MQNLTAIEKLTEPKLIAAYGEADGKALWGNYLVARKKAVHEILPFIKTTEPNLTDHGPEHVKEVLENALALLGEKACSSNDSKSALNANELYFLTLGILFHDLGNIHGRKEHNSRLENVYAFARGTDGSLIPEKRQLFSIVEAHCGQTRDGSKDTIGKLDRNGSFRKQLLDCQRVAAVLRLADELAEGPQRTSLFMQKHFAYPKESEVFHDYANVTEVCIDRTGERLVLTFDIEIRPDSWHKPFDKKRLTRLLEFCYERAIKLDLERKYNRHYCSMLRPFKKTEISFHFHLKGEDLHLGIPKIVLDDLVLPRPTKALLLDYKEKFPEVNALIPKLRQAASLT